MRNIKSAYNSRVLLADSASEKMWQDLDHSIEPVDILNITNPDIILDRHIAHLKAGADVIHTNSFGAFPLDLEKSGYGEEAFIINYLAAETAARAVDSVPGNGRRRFVAGVIQADNLKADVTKIEKAASLQAEGLIAGGVDYIAIHLTDDTLDTISLIKGVVAKRDKLSPQTAVYVYRNQKGSNQTAADDLADGAIKIANGDAASDKWLAVALSGERPNLITGGDSAHDTAVIDANLRDWAQDGLRPTLKATRRTITEGFMPASSSRRFDDLNASS